MHNKRQLLSLLLLTSLLVTSCGGILYTPPTSADYCGIDPALLEPETEGKTVLELWGNNERHTCLRSYAPLLAVNQHPDLPISVRVSDFDINGNPFAAQLMDLAARGEAPDIAFLNYSNVVQMVEAGHLHPLDECRLRPEFQPIPELFWSKFMVDDQVWSIFVDIQLMLLFYNKGMLHRLGWTHSQIDQLPHQIASGDYELNDLVVTAREAIEAGAVQSGLAFIPSRNQRSTIVSQYLELGGPLAHEKQRNFSVNQEALESTYAFLATLHKHQLLDTRMAEPNFPDWGMKLVLRDAATHDRFLFWNAYASEFQWLVEDYADNSGDALSLSKQIGAALVPASEVGRRGYAHTTNAGHYVIFTPQATGRENQNAACDLLAATYASGLLEQHTQRSGHATIGTGGLNMAEWFPTEVPLHNLLWAPPFNPDSDEFQDILAETGVLVERGELTVSEAVDVAIERLRDAFGSRLIVE